MIRPDIEDALRQQLDALHAAGVYRRERILSSPQAASVTVQPGGEVLNFCSNNYLGLSNHPAVIAAAHAALDRWGYGLSSGRIICGTQEIHTELEQRLSHYLGTEDTILYGSCFDANGGLFEVLLGEEDAVVSDALNHASIIDGVRLSKAKRFRYANNDLVDLERQLVAAATARLVLIATDGVFSMDGVVADLKGICDLADRSGALVMVDDSHGVGVMGATGRGSHEAAGVISRVDVLTGTLGKALGGASGGYVSGRASIIELLRQRSRPYIFSNSVAPVIVATSLAILERGDLLDGLRLTLWENAKRFRAGMVASGFEVIPGEHPIVPVMLRDAASATRMAERLLELGIYVVAFSFPIVPKDQARIRVQISAAHAPAQIDRALEAFMQVGREMGVI